MEYLENAVCNTVPLPDAARLVARRVGVHQSFATALGAWGGVQTVGLLEMHTF